MNNEEFLKKFKKLFTDLYGELEGTLIVNNLKLKESLEINPNKEFKLYNIRENIHGILDFLEKYQDDSSVNLDKYIKNINDNLKLYKEIYTGK